MDLEFRKLQRYVAEHPDDVEAADRLRRMADRLGPEAPSAVMARPLAEAVHQAAARRSGKLTGAAAEGLIRDAYLARGWTRDPLSHKSILSPDGTFKIVFEDRVVQTWRGGRGKWVKRSSSSKIAVAEQLRAKAEATVTGSEAPLQAHRAKVEAKRTKAKSKASAKALLDLQKRLAVVRLSASLAPAERLVGAIRSLPPRLAGPFMPSAAEVEGVAAAQIDRLLTVDTPPTIVEGYTKADAWPTSFTWAEGPYDVTVSKDRRERLSVEIGSTGRVGLRVDPESFSVRGVSTHREAPGYVSGYLTVDRDGTPLAALSMISSTVKKSGAGTDMVRLFCRLVKGYGLDGFVAVAVGEEGQAFFERLAARGSVWIERLGDSNNWWVECGSGLEASRAQGQLWRF